MSGEGTTSINNLPTDNVYEPKREHCYGNHSCSESNATSANATPTNATTTNAILSKCNNKCSHKCNNNKIIQPCIPDLHRHKLDKRLIMTLQ